MLQFRRILCPTDFSEPSYEALRVARELASTFGAELLLVHVLPVVPPLPLDPKSGFEIPEYERALHRDAIDKLAEVRQTRVPAELHCRELVSHGDPASAIAETAENEEVDLIVTATHGSRGWQRLLFGSVAEKVVRHAHCPVLTVGAPRKWWSQVA